MLASLDGLFQMVNPSLPQNAYFPKFAQEKIWWLVEQQKQGRLDVVLLNSLANTNLTADDLMSSAIVNGRLTLAVVQTRLTTFLAEGKVNQLQIKNDFMLGVVHEVVHLQNPKLASSNHLAEEQRAWREVNSNVVRKLRASKQPMNKRFIAVDDALKACKDQLPCPSLARILLPSEIRR